MFVPFQSGWTVPLILIVSHGHSRSILAWSALLSSLETVQGGRWVTNPPEAGFY
jgi:hypothetical protein